MAAKPIIIFLRNLEAYEYRPSPEDPRYGQYLEEQRKMNEEYDAYRLSKWNENSTNHTNYTTNTPASPAGQHTTPK